MHLCWAGAEIEARFEPAKDGDPEGVIGYMVFPAVIQVPRHVGMIRDLKDED